MSRAGRRSVSVFSCPPVVSQAAGGVHGETMGSGTHGLQTRTFSPPDITGISSGALTTFWRSSVILCGLQAAQTTLPHFLQWCLRLKKWKATLQTGHWLTSSSGCHGGGGISIMRLLIVGGCGGEGVRSIAVSLVEPVRFRFLISVMGRVLTSSGQNNVNMTFRWQSRTCHLQQNTTSEPTKLNIYCREHSTIPHSRRTK